MRALYILMVLICKQFYLCYYAQPQLFLLRSLMRDWHAKAIIFMKAEADRSIALSYWGDQP